MIKLINTILLFIITCSIGHAQLYRMEKNERWGFINTQGEWVIESQYLWAANFSDGIAAVASAASGCWILIDEAGNITSEKELCPYGINANNFRPQQMYDPFAEGIAPATIDRQVKYVNKQARVVIPGPFLSAFPHQEGLARVQNPENRKYGFIDLKGNMVINYKFDDAQDFKNGLAAAAIEKDDKEFWGFIGKQGNWVIDPKFHEVGDFQEGMAWAQTFPEKQKNGFYSLTGIVNRSGEWVIEPEFKEIKDFSQGLAPARKKRDWGYIDQSGNWVIDDKFDEAETFTESLGVVKNDDGWFFIDEEGNAAFENSKMKDLIHLFPYDGELALGVFSLNEQGGYFSMGSGDYRQFMEAYYGYVDKQGNWVSLPPDEEIEQRKQALKQAKEEEKAAEERKKQSKSQQEMAALEQCADNVTYGTESENWIEISVKGIKRTFYFDKSTIVKHQNNQLDIYFPPFGLSPELREARSDQKTSGLFAGMIKSMINKWSKFNLHINPSATFSSDKYEFTNTNIFNIDCLTDVGNKYIRNLMDSYEAQMQYSSKSDNEKIAITFESKLTSDTTTYLKVHSYGTPQTNTVIDKNEIGKLIDKYNIPGDKAELVNMIYYPEMGYLSYQEEGYSRYNQIFLPREGSKLVGYPSTRAFSVYQFNKIDNELIIISQYLIGEPLEGVAPTPFIEDPLLVSSNNLDQLNLTDHKLQKVYISKELVVVDSQPLLIKAEDITDGQKYANIPEQEEEPKPQVGLLDLPASQTLPTVTGNTAYTLSSPSEKISVSVNEKTIEIKREKVEAGERIANVKRKLGKYYQPFMAFALTLEEESAKYAEDPEAYIKWWTNQLKQLGVTPPDSDNPMAYQKALFEHYSYIDDNIYEELVRQYVKNEYGHVIEGIRNFEKLMSGNKTEKQLQLVADNFHVHVDPEITLDQQIAALQDSVENKYSPTLLNTISLATRSEDNEKDEINPVVNIKRMKNDQMNVSYHFARLVGLTVDISFVKDTMHLSTNHPDQEKAEKWWKVTDGLIDINYLLAVLPELDLNEKYSQEIYFSYFIANPLSRFSSSTGNYKIYQVRPLFSKVDITYVDKEKVEIEGQKVKTHHLQLNFQNDVYAQPIFPAIRDGGVMEVWLTTDQSQVPVKLSTDREFWYNYSIE